MSVITRILRKPFPLSGEPARRGMMAWFATGVTFRLRRGPPGRDKSRSLETISGVSPETICHDQRTVIIEE